MGTPALAARDRHRKFCAAPAGRHQATISDASTEEMFILLAVAATTSFQAECAAAILNYSCSLRHVLTTFTVKEVIHVVLRGS